MPNGAIRRLGLVAALSCAAPVLWADTDGEKPPKNPTLPVLKPTMDPPDIVISPAQEKELLAAMKESSPKHYYAYLVALKKSDPALYKKSLAYFWKMYLEWRNAPKHVAAAVLTEREETIKIGKLVQRLRLETDAARQQELTGQILQAVQKKFDAEVVIRDYRLQQFELRIKKLRGELKDKISRREQIVAERLKTWLDRAKEPAATPK